MRSATVPRKAKGHYYRNYTATICASGEAGQTADQNGCRRTEVSVFTVLVLWTVRICLNPLGYLILSRLWGRSVLQELLPTYSELLVEYVTDDSVLNGSAHLRKLNSQHMFTILVGVHVAYDTGDRDGFARKW